MKKGIIVRNAYFSAPQVDYQVERIKYELTALGAEVKVVKNGYDFFVNEKGEIASNLDGVDFCVFLDKDKYLGKMINSLGIKTFNPISAIEICDDKMLTVLALAGTGVKMPKTFSSPLCFTSGVKITTADLEPVKAELGLPFVIKLSFSSLGKGVFLANDLDTAVQIINERPFEPKIFQEFIPSSYGRDVRVICIGGKYLCAMQRISDGDFRSNAALGGRAEPFNPPKSFIETAEKVAKALKLDYMGVDLLFGKDGEPILCEVNSNAFFTVMEKTVNVNVAKAYAEHILNSL